jgi:hypothetical protein
MGADPLPLVDLDAAAALFTEPLPMTTHTVAVQRRKVALAMVAELRVAREVICEADSVAAFLPLEVVRKLDAYHAAVARHDPPAGGNQAEDGGS